MSAPVWEFEHSVVAPVGRRAAWDFWTDPAELMRLEGEAVESIEIDGPFAAGAKGITRQGGEAIHWSVAHCDAPRRATIEIALEGAVFRTHWTFEEEGEASTKMTQRMELVGDNVAPYVEFMELLAANAPRGMARLAEAMERRGG